MINWPAPLAILVEVFLAMLLGGVIGIERTTANKPAGFRTHMLVAGAAALLVVERCPDSTVQPRCLHRLDTIGSDQAIITASAFSGAGSIFRHPKKQHVEDITTAASLLFSGAIGFCVARR
jgi:putative Mg2+ transporter-C (MgtC) family protein